MVHSPGPYSVIVSLESGTFSENEKLCYWKKRYFLDKITSCFHLAFVSILYYIPVLMSKVAEEFVVESIVTSSKWKTNLSFSININKLQAMLYFFCIQLRKTIYYQ